MGDIAKEDYVVKKYTDAGSNIVIPDNYINSTIETSKKQVQPKVCVYTASNPLTVECISKIKAVIDLFASKGILEKEIVVITCNQEQIQKFQSTKPVEFPQIFLGDQVIGTVEELYGCELSGKLGDLLKNENLIVSSIVLGNKDDIKTDTADDPEKLELGVFDQWINAAEWTIKGMSNGVWSTWQYVRKGSDAANQPEKKELNYVLQPNDVEIEVIRTNWLWRNQKRVFRFTAKKFMRIIPDTKEIKETFEYTDVQELIMRGKNNMVIVFRNGIESQYLQSLQCQKIKELILDRAGLDISIPVTIQK